MKHKVLVVGTQGILGGTLVSKSSRDVEFLSQNRGNWSLDYLQPDVRTVVYLRAISSPTYVHQFPIESHQLNVDKSRDFIQGCLELNKRIIFSSSDVVYGDTANKIASESSSIMPFGEYGKQKAEIESSFHDSENFIALRLSLIVGEGSKLRRILKNESSPSIPDPVMRNPVNIRHVVNLIERLSLTKTWNQNLKVLNVGGSDQISMYELAKLESKKFNLHAPVKIMRSPLDVVARPQTVRMYSKLAEDFLGTKFGLD
jgi:dTDP-4-dehydrorhamnose reductase